MECFICRLRKQIKQAILHWKGFILPVSQKSSSLSTFPSPSLSLCSHQGEWPLPCPLLLHPLWVVLSGLVSFTLMMLIILLFSSASWKCVVLPAYCQLLCQDYRLCVRFANEVPHLSLSPLVLYPKILSGQGHLIPVGF